MFALLRILSILFCLMTVFFCAQRDNKFDPLSPLYRHYRPELHIALIPDSSKILSISASQETLSVYVPINLRLIVNSTGGENDTDEFPVFITHFLNGVQVGLPVSSSSQEILLTDTGTHVFLFETSYKPGDSVTTKNVVIFATPTPAPKPILFTSNSNKFAIRHESNVIFKSKFYDRFRITEKIAYEFSSYRTVYHQISGNTSDTITDSLSYPITKSWDDTEIVTIRVTDIFDRTDSLKLSLIFSKDIPFVKGLPPIINMINADPDTAAVNENIEFIVRAFDSDGKIIDYEWYFSDSVTGRGPSFVRSFKSPGIYTARVKVTDDSGSTDIDSIHITILSSDNASPLITSFIATPDSGMVPLTVNFSVTAIDKDDSNFSYSWYFEPFSFEKTYSPVISHTFGCPCDLPVMVVVKDPQRNADTAFVNLKFIQNANPELCISPSTINCNQKFTVMLLPGNLGSIDTNTTHFTWVFPDRTYHLNSSILFQQQIYRPGNYQISLIIHGAINDTIFKKITVSDLPPK